jgi:type IV pilus assembly protein PilA
VIEAIQRRMAARSDEDRQGGFTLIELMVVVMIIAILVGIAIPAFLGARKRAQDTAAKSNVRNALSTAQTVFSDNQAYGASADLEAALANEEPSLVFVPAATASADAKEISVATDTTTGGSTEDIVYFAAKSKSGKCFYLRHVATAGDPGPVSGSYMAEAGATATCTAAQGITDDATLPWDSL